MTMMSRHDVILDCLEDRICGYNRYHKVFRNLEYERGDLKGEIDLLAYDAKHGVWHMYEVKSSNRPARLIKAWEQYTRFCKAFPEYEVKGVFVSPNKTMRL